MSAPLLAPQPTTYIAKVRLRLVTLPVYQEPPDPDAHGDEDRGSMWALGWLAIALSTVLLLTGVWFGARRLHEWNPAVSAALWLTAFNVFLLFVVAKLASR